MQRLGRLLVIAAFAALAVNAAPQTARPAEAAGCIRIYKIYFDSPGTDTGTNTSRNGEWIQLRNACASGKSLYGWKVRDLANHVYRFGTYTLGAGKLVKIHTGKGTNTSTDRYWGSAYYIWNNDKDTAYLVNAAGTRVGTCSYTAAGGNPKLC
jgi:hypothetical protein